MLQISNVGKAYGQRVLLEGATAAIGKGERVGLVGRNGSGKTTLIKMMMGVEQADEGAIGMPSGYRIGHLSQRLLFSEGTVLGEACLALRPGGDGSDETYRAKAVLQGLGIREEDMHRDPLELSGGYQIRLNLAKVLISEPDLLLLDEPTNYLDILSIRWLERFLNSWRAEMVLITHDRAFMDSVTTHTMAIHRGRLIKTKGGTGKLYAEIAEAEEHHERARLNEEKKRREAERFIERFRAQATRARAVQSRIKALQRLGRHERLKAEHELDFAFTYSPFNGKSLMKAEALSYAYPGRQPLIKGLSLTIEKNDRIGVIGRNGAGKSTFLRLLMGELAPSSGSITRHQAAEVGYFGQSNVDRLNPAHTVEEAVSASNPALGRKDARAACGAMMFEGDEALKKIGVLSGGERSRVLLGALLLKPANLLVLDEPTNHLDMQAVDSLIEALAAFEGAVVFVTHSDMVLNALAERLIVFDGGQTRVFYGTYGDFLDKVGFSEEAEAEGEKGRSLPQPRQASKGDLRRARAEVISAKSRVLTPLSKAISSLEARIAEQEALHRQTTMELVRASEVQDAGAIGRLSKLLHDTGRLIESLYEELHPATEEFELKSREFESLLGDAEDKRQERPGNRPSGALPDSMRKSEAG